MSNPISDPLHERALNNAHDDTPPTPSDLNDRLRLIESMIQEGRRKTESWGWTFVLWGVAYFVAIGWTALGSKALAWPITMIAAAILTAVLSARQSGHGPETTMSRALGALWGGMGVSMFVLFFSMGFSQRFEPHMFVAVLGAMMGAANAASSILLRWRAQFACALVWWATSVIACFATEAQTSIVYLVAIFLCQIVFGIYAMLRDRNARMQCEAAHAKTA
jgi:hypothetical protein